eukprot:m.1310593 g.1310593  ORF g.1310593 m.1310593 type:complete len:227 (+) comp24826_c0_seq7:265-945(+)
MCCLDGSPHEDDPRSAYQQYGRQWETDMMHAGCNNFSGCCIAMFCPPCFACHLRAQAIQGDWNKWKCCQGYICPGCCSCCDDIGHNNDCQKLCLCLEVMFFEPCAISATRIYVQEERQITTDPCDNRLIRFNNIVQLLSVICDILAIINGSFRHIARILDNIANIVYCLTQACMQSQTHLELTLHPTAVDYAEPLIVHQPGPSGSERAPLLAAPPPAYSQVPPQTK